MPTYQVLAVNLQLTSDMKKRIAACITQTHHRQTGAPQFLVQVIFRARDCTDHFIGGQPNSAPQIFIHGVIRSGRSNEIKAGLISDAIKDVSAVADISSEDIWIYLHELDANDMAEFGRILPQSGEERVWMEGISPHKQSQLERGGVKF